MNLGTETEGNLYTRSCMPHVGHEPRSLEQVREGEGAACRRRGGPCGWEQTRQGLGARLRPADFILHTRGCQPVPRKDPDPQIGSVRQISKVKLVANT